MNQNNIQQSLLETMYDNYLINIVKNIKEILSDDSREKNISLNQAKEILAEISEDQNLQTFSRTQIWNISSILEEVGSEL